MPEADWANLFAVVCDRILKTYDEFKCTAYEGGYIRAIHGAGIGSV